MRMFEHAPPPMEATLFDSTQLSSVPRNAPPPWLAELPARTQFEMMALEDSHQTPPPLLARTTSPVAVLPLVKVNPLKTAPLVIYTQRPGLGAGAKALKPRMVVWPGPLRL